MIEVWELRLGRFAMLPPSDVWLAIPHGSPVHAPVAHVARPAGRNAALFPAIQHGNGENDRFEAILRNVERLSTL